MKNFILIAAAIIVACSKPAAEITIEKEPAPVAVADSVEVTLTLENAGWAATVRHTDIFVYEQSGLMALESHVRLDSLPQEVRIKTTPGQKKYVAICNCPYGFNLSAIKKYESVELLSFNFKEDNPEAPLLSGTVQGEGAISLSPLLCRVILEEISNGMDGYELLENPRIYLTGANPSAEILRTEGFHPKEELEDAGHVDLPCDIGFFSQHPGTTLYCYPNDTPDDILGCIRACFNLECSINGKTYVFRTPLPQMGRGATVHIRMTVNSPEEYYFSVEVFP